MLVELDSEEAFLERGEECNVILQSRDSDRATSDLTNIYVRSATTRALVPLSSLVHVEETAGPIELKCFNRRRSITLSANLTPGYSLGDRLRRGVLVALDAVRRAGGLYLRGA